MLCPSCDGIVNILGCQACGWKTGEATPAHRLTPETRHPLIPGMQYADSVGTKAVFALVENPPQEFTPRIAPGFNSTPEPVVEVAVEIPVEVPVSPAIAAEPEPETVVEMGDSLTKSVQ